MGRFRGLEQTVLVALAAGAGFAAYDNLGTTREQLPSIVVSPPRVVVTPVRPESAPVIQVTAPTVPIVVQAPSAGPAEPILETAKIAWPGELGSCSRPRRDPFAKDDRPEAPEFAYDESTSRWNPRLRAAWGDGRVALSTDGGLSWFESLELPETYVVAVGEVDTSVLDVDFDCHGRAFVIRRGEAFGMLDLHGSESESWTRVPALRGHETAVLAISEEEVAIVLDDPVVLGDLLLARRNEHERWAVHDLWSDSAYGSWDGVSVVSLEYRKDDRFVAEVVPWQGGECGYEEFFQVSFTLDGAVRSKQLAEL